MELDVENLPSEFSLGHYVIQNRVAIGGMGVVYRAFEPLLKRTVAVKVLRRHFAEEPAAVWSFQEEARAIAAISHPNIVPIHFIGTENGCAFFSMAFIEGCTLDDWIEEGQFFTEQDAFWFLDQAIAALDAALRANIVHLDIKPSNFLVNHQGQLFLTDFGLAQNLAGVPSLTQGKSSMGTPYYASPEQILQVHTDQRTDIYSLGATLFHLMVKEPPFKGNSARELLKGHIYGEFPGALAQAAGLSEGWIQLLKRMLEKEPEQRFADYGELSDAVNGLRPASSLPVELTAPKRTDVLESDVFIAYSDADQELATKVCQFLEQKSIRCWLAHRDIGSGASRATSFVLAITRTKVVLVLLSKNANNSSQVQREVDEAAHFGRPIITVRIEDVEPCADLASLGKTQKLDAFSEENPTYLDRVAELVQKEMQELKLREQPEAPPVPVSRYRKLATRISILSCLTLFCLGLAFVPPRVGPSNNALALSPAELETIASNIKSIEAEEKILAPLPKHPIGHGVNLALDQYYAASLDTMMKAIDLLATAGVNRIDLTPPTAYWGPHFIQVDQALCAYIRKKGMQVQVAPPISQVDTTGQTLTMGEFQDKCCAMDEQIASELHPDYFFVLSNVPVVLKTISIQPAPTVEDWTRFVTATSASVKKADPNIRVGFAGNAAEQDLIKTLINLPCVDVVGLDIFTIPDLTVDRSLASRASQAHKPVILRRTWHPSADKQQWIDFAAEANQEMDSKWITMIDTYAKTGPFDSVAFYDGPAFFVYMDGRSPGSAAYMGAAAEAAGRNHTTAAFQALKQACAR